MCGRAAQTNHSLQSAEAILLQLSIPHNNNINKHDGNMVSSQKPLRQSSAIEFPNGSHQKFNDNLNLSPGMKGVVFCKELSTDDNRPTTNDNTASTTNHSTSNTLTLKICMRVKVWGIVPREGTKKSPLDEGPGQHFSNMMYNARSDTLYEKKTYRDLAIRGNTCVWAIDGFFEWKQPGKNVLSNSSAKQPYFIQRRDGLPLLIPGLWKSVRTGRKRHRQQEIPGGSVSSPDDILLDTFTHLTTDACEPLQWIHHRQPVFLWNSELATEWIMNPSEGLVTQMASSASSMTEKDSLLMWHPVTKLMSNVKYQNVDSVERIKIETVPSVKSFFIGGVSSNNRKITKAQHINNKNVTAFSGLKTKGKYGMNPKKNYIGEDLVSQNPSKTEEQKQLYGDNLRCKKTQFKKGDYEAKTKTKKGTITSFFTYK